MRTMAQHFYVRRRKVQHYKNIVIEYGHFRLKITGVSRPNTNRNASQVPALSYRLPYLAKQTTPSAPCHLRTVIKVD